MKNINKSLPQILGREMCGIHIILLTCIHSNDELRRATREENCQLSKHATQPVTTQCLHVCGRQIRYVCGLMWNSTYLADPTDITYHSSVKNQSQLQILRLKTSLHL